MENKRTPQISPQRDRELREHFRALEHGETPPPLTPVAAKPAIAELKPKGKGAEGLGTGKMGDNMKGLGGMEGLGRGRFRG